MALLGIGILILVVVIFLAIAIFVIRNVLHLVINAIVGLLTLFIVNSFHLMEYAGKPDIGYDLITVLICALGGFFGALLLIVLGLAGISL